MIVTKIQHQNILSLHPEKIQYTCHYLSHFNVCIFDICKRYIALSEITDDDKRISRLHDQSSFYREA